MRLPKLLGKIIGGLLVLSFFLPIPLGTLRLVIGLSILVCASLPFALAVQAGRRKFGWFNRSMIWLEDKIGERWAGTLMLTRPENDPRNHFSGSPQPANSTPQVESQEEQT